MPPQLLGLELLPCRRISHRSPTLIFHEANVHTSLTTSSEILGKPLSWPFPVPKIKKSLSKALYYEALAGKSSSVPIILKPTLKKESTLGEVEIARWKETKKKEQKQCCKSNIFLEYFSIKLYLLQSQHKKLI